MLRVLFVVVPLVAALLIGAAAAHWPRWQHQTLLEQEGVQIFSQELPVRNGDFLNQSGQPIKLSDLTGRNLLVFFGYTFCPDICPATLMDLSRIWRQLPAQIRDEWQVVLVSVDPERDTPTNLSPYMGYFNKSFVALTGNEQSLSNIAADLNAIYSKVERGAEQPYLMDHSANIAIIDSHGNYRGYIAPPHGAKRMVPLLTAITGLLP